MAQVTNNLNRSSICEWLVVVVLLAFALCSQVFASPVSYSYDNLNRLKEVNYGNGQQVITYAYDAAGNILSRTVSEGEGPVLTISGPVDGQYINTPAVTMTGTASDAGVGDNGIASVTVNTVPATGGTTTGADTADWSIGLGLVEGLNIFTVVATDGSVYANQTSATVLITYIPFVVDTDGDGLDDTFETAIGTNPGLADTDGDGINDGQEISYDTDGSFFNPLTDTDPLNPDSDGDGVSDGVELADGTNPLDNTSFVLYDVDGDGVADFFDNCVLVPNPGQEDTDIDGVGDACQVGITGIWPADALEGEFVSVFIFGENFTTDNTTEVYFNGICQYLVAPVTTDMLIVRVPVSASLFGPITVTTPSDTEISTQLFGAPLTGLNLTGIWPGSPKIGEFTSIFLFGTEFTTDNTTEVYFNGVRQWLVAPVTSEMLIVRVLGAAELSGLVDIVTPSGSATSAEALNFVP